MEIFPFSRVLLIIASICFSDAWINHYVSRNGLASLSMISSGFSFEDGKQILVSVQKPFGLVLEQDDDGVIVVTEVDASGSAGRAGVRVGDVLAAVQNALVESADLDSVLDFIGNGPKVMNLRLIREDIQ
jgi:C-terminal processing protease CtpA/Prc